MGKKNSRRHLVVKNKVERLKCLEERFSELAHNVRDYLCEFPANEDDLRTFHSYVTKQAKLAYYEASMVDMEMSGETGGEVSDGPPAPQAGVVEGGEAEVESPLK